MFFNDFGRSIYNFTGYWRNP